MQFSYILDTWLHDERLVLAANVSVTDADSIRPGVNILDSFCGSGPQLLTVNHQISVDWHSFTTTEGNLVHFFTLNLQYFSQLTLFFPKKLKYTYLTGTIHLQIRIEHSKVCQIRCYCLHFPTVYKVTETSSSPNNYIKCWLHVSASVIITHFHTCHTWKGKSAL